MVYISLCLKQYKTDALIGTQLQNTHKLADLRAFYIKIASNNSILTVTIPARFYYSVSNYNNEKIIIKIIYYWFYSPY